jgi:hypothetical protein
MASKKVKFEVGIPGVAEVQPRPPVSTKHDKHDKASREDDVIGEGYGENVQTLERDIDYLQSQYPSKYACLGRRTEL